MLTEESTVELIAGIIHRVCKKLSVSSDVSFLYQDTYQVTQILSNCMALPHYQRHDYLSSHAVDGFLTNFATELVHEHIKQTYPRYTGQETSHITGRIGFSIFCHLLQIESILLLQNIQNEWSLVYQSPYDGELQVKPVSDIQIHRPLSILIGFDDFQMELVSLVAAKENFTVVSSPATMLPPGSKIAQISWKRFMQDLIRHANQKFKNPALSKETQRLEAVIIETTTHEPHDIRLADELFSRDQEMARLSHTQMKTQNCEMSLYFKKLSPQARLRIEQMKKGSPNTSLQRSSNFQRIREGSGLFFTQITSGFMRLGRFHKSL